MFLENNYTKDYYTIINMAINRLPTGTTRRQAKNLLLYVERHHIIPKSMGGTNDSSNLVWLTAEEHLHVHLLLPYMVVEEKNKRKMLAAAVRMANPQSKTQKRLLGDNLISGINEIRKQAAEFHSKFMSERNKGPNNPFYGKKHSLVTKEKLKFASANRIMTDQMHINYSQGRKNFYQKHPEKKPYGAANPKFLNTIHEWENIYTGEKIVGTRYDMVNKFPALKSNISQVINGNYTHAKGWKINKY